MDLISLVTAFGLGSILTILVQAWFARRNKLEDRSFEERKMAYIGLLEAYHRAAVEGTDDAAKNFAYWQLRCELVAPRFVRECVARIVETNENPAERAKAHEALKADLRRDLGIVAKD